MDESSSALEKIWAELLAMHTHQDAPIAGPDERVYNLHTVYVFLLQHLNELEGTSCLAHSRLYLLTLIGNPLNDEYGQPTTHQLWATLHSSLPPNMQQLFEIQVSL